LLTRAQNETSGSRIADQKRKKESPEIRSRRFILPGEASEIPEMSRARIQQSMKDSPLCGNANVEIMSHEQRAAMIAMKRMWGSSE
jgi:hypothetical protein